MSNAYENTDLFVDDIRLVFDNCLLYNEPSCEVGVAGTKWCNTFF